MPNRQQKLVEEKIHQEKANPQTMHSSQTTGVGGIGLLVEVTNLAWNLVFPIVGGVLLGHFIDTRNGDGFTWTLSLLALGVLIAFMNLYELNVEHRHHIVETTNSNTSDQVVDDEEK